LAYDEYYGSNENTRKVFARRMQNSKTRKINRDNTYDIL